MEIKEILERLGDAVRCKLSRPVLVAADSFFYIVAFSSSREALVKR